MTVEEMVKEFLCAGCVGGMDTKCGHYKQPDGYNGCLSHCLGTRIFPAPGLIALGMPKGFNRPFFFREDGTKPPDQPHHPLIRLHPKSETVKPYDKFNVPVWALEKDGFLFVRGMMPRIGDCFDDVFEMGKASEICPQAVNVTDMYGEYD